MKKDFSEVQQDNIINQEEAVEAAVGTLVEQIISGGEEVVSEQQLDEWKIQYGDIYKTDIGDQTFYWHKMRRKDYVELMTDKEFDGIDSTDLRIFLRQEKILKSCVIWPEGDILDDIIENNAGVATNISDEIMLASGFKSPKTEKI